MRVLSALFSRDVPDPAVQAANESGLTSLKFTKRSANIITHPNDLYIRVAPDGPYDRANQGWQKQNAISTIGTERPDIDNPLQSARNYRPNGNIQLNGFAPVGDGPAMFSDDESASDSSNNPGLLSTIFGRLGK